MALRSILRVRKQQLLHSKERPAAGNGNGNGTDSETRASSRSDSRHTGHNVSKEDVKRSTTARRVFSMVAASSYFLAWIFLVLVVIGNTSNKRVLNDIYFFKLSLADIIPTSVPNAQLINSIAQSIGLHDFYQVGLWNFCEGYDSVGITSCSKPQTLYWFNPVDVLMSELLAGATIALPTQVMTILTILRIASQIMFGFFLTAAVLSFVLIFASPLAVLSRWWSLPLALLGGIATALTTAASIVGSVISFVFKYAAEAQSDLNIHAQVGIKMFVFMWLASGFALIAFIAHAGMGCCCTSARDIKIGRRHIKPPKAASSSATTTEHGGNESPK
ncbi:hypothetical protein GQ53DRAFT_473149 [Thozetella sp. PMI_491]|nr:hypothetical protein GQ53DRAFT_473149 [Thozetella sp. PMI_491]